MNKWAWISFGTVILHVLIFLLLRGPDVHLGLVVTIGSSLSLIGMFCALLSKRVFAGTAGFVLNGGGLLVMFFLLLAMGIRAP